ncbi:uncharacterized protein [Prorops nasuta]
MESDLRGRTSRASSTSSLEVRCGCQYYQSDSLLPERRALTSRPSSRAIMRPPTGRCSEHEYEPIGAARQLQLAPVVRFTDTDVTPVADSDDERAKSNEDILPDGDIVLPLDGKIEDCTMEARELVETGDTSEESAAQNFQDQVEERFLSTATPATESRTDGELNTSQVDSTMLEELPLQRGARGLPQRIRSQAVKLRSRFQGLHPPKFSFEKRRKAEKPRSTSSGKSDKPKTEKKPTRMDRIRSSLPERPKFDKFHLPARPKFHLPDRSKLHLPEAPKFHLKKPNLKLPSSLTSHKKPPLKEQQRQRSTESTAGSRGNIFDFATVPRIFSRKSKSSKEYATSSPKDSRAQSAESATLPRTGKRKSLTARWSERFAGTAGIGDEDSVPAERVHPWRHPSLEEPRLSIRMEEEVIVATRNFPWAKSDTPREDPREIEEDIRYMEYEPDSAETSERQVPSRSEDESKQEDSYDHRYRRDQYRRTKGKLSPEKGEWESDEILAAQVVIRPMQRSMSDQVVRGPVLDRYEGSFPSVDPRRFDKQKGQYEELEYEEDEEAQSSFHSDKEIQQSSGSSVDRRRLGYVEEVDFDEFFIKEKDISEDKINIRSYLATEIRQALMAESSFADESVVTGPPERPARKRILRKRREGSVESYDALVPVRPKRERVTSRPSVDSADAPSEETNGSRHRIIYQAEVKQREHSEEPLDDMIVVKPVRRKSSASLRSQSRSKDVIVLENVSSETPIAATVISVPPAAPVRKKRSKNKSKTDLRTSQVVLENGLDAQLKDDLMIEEEAKDLERNVSLFADEDQDNPEPAPPKRRSRSRTVSMPPDEDRTSRGAESLPEAEFIEDIPLDARELSQDPAGYAIVDKVEKARRPSPPLRRRKKFSTTPRQKTPKRPIRAYSTLGPVRSREENILFPDSMELQSSYAQIAPDDGELKDLRSGEVMHKIQRRPLPAPPRPPRSRKEKSEEPPLPVIEVATATQTDPLPDDVVIEEEVTQGKLIMSPSRSGSQIFISQERIPTPSSLSTPPIPPLPTNQFLRGHEDSDSSREGSFERTPSPINKETREKMTEHDRETATPEESRHRYFSTLQSDEPLRIASLEVGDLKVDRLSVSQLDAHKITASEVDAMIIATSELRAVGSTVETALSTSLLRELIAIRSHLENPTTPHERSVPEEKETSTTREDSERMKSVEDPVPKSVEEGEKIKGESLKAERSEKKEEAKNVDLEENNESESVEQLVPTEEDARKATLDIASQPSLT